MSDGGTTPPAGGPAASPAAGWYRDPQGATRWWDGSGWTSQVAPAGPAAETPPQRTSTVLAEADPAVPVQERPPGARWNPLASFSAFVSGSLSRVGSLGRAGSPGRAGSLGRLGSLGSLSRRTWLVVGAVVLVVALAAGYLLFGRGSDSDVPAAAPVLTPSATVAQVTLTTADLRGGLKTVLIRGGGQVKGQITFASCGYRFTSESHRVARRQVNIVSAAGDQTGVSNEVVVYDSAASAAKALAEVRTAAAHCPNRYVVDPARGKPAIRTSAVKTKTTAGAASTGPAAAFDERLTLTDTVQVNGYKQAEYEAAIIIRKGALVDILWMGRASKLTAGDLRVLAALADITVRKFPTG